jgi:hypothetical protein
MSEEGLAENDGKKVTATKGMMSSLQEHASKGRRIEVDCLIGRGDQLCV